MVIIANSNLEAEELIDGILDKKLSKNNNEILALIAAKVFLPKYVNDHIARCVISGNPEKPISKKLFNKLRVDGKIETYHPSEGRTAYNVDQLYQYIESTKNNILK